MGGPWKFGWGSIDDDESSRRFATPSIWALNWIDTAAVYGLGHSEEVVARAIGSFDVGEDVFIFTKCERNWFGSKNGEEIVPAGAAMWACPAFSSQPPD